MGGDQHSVLFGSERPGQQVCTRRPGTPLGDLGRPWKDLMLPLSLNGQVGRSRAQHGVFLEGADVSTEVLRKWVGWWLGSLGGQWLEP